MSNVKSWSKKKKIIVITLSIVAFLLVAIIGGGLYALHWYCSVEEYDIQSSQYFAHSDTSLIAHRGFRAVAPENTAPAFEEAGKEHFWGAECDVYMTANGVWVVQHDPITYRMMDATKSIEKCTIDELMKYNTDNGNNIDKYSDLKICTLGEYLDICDVYSMVPIIEIKGKNNTEHYDKIVEAVEAHRMQAVYISFEEENLYAMRKLTDAPMFLLTQKITDEDIATAKDIGHCGIDFNGNKKKNYDDNNAMIKKCQQEGLTLGVWTIDDLDTFQAMVDLGIEYITTDCITY